eukprot:sb/3477084/
MAILLVTTVTKERDIKRGIPPTLEMDHCSHVQCVHRSNDKPIYLGWRNPQSEKHSRILPHNHERMSGWGSGDPGWASGVVAHSVSGRLRCPEVGGRRSVAPPLGESYQPEI